MKKALTLSRPTAGTNSNKARTFGDEELQQAVPSIGCGFSAKDNDQIIRDPLGNADMTSPSRRRRRLQHVSSPGECNNVTNFFCWMQCVEVPNHEQARGYVNEGYSLYCLDPATLASTGNRVSSAAAPCESGWVHNAACQGSWQPTAPGVIAYPLNVEAQEGDYVVQESFCYGGTSMYMDGFHWLNPTCVIYLFPKWVLSTPAKLASAAIGTLASGMALEKIIQQRRIVISFMDPGYKRLGVSSIFYGFQLTLGYFIMLVVMTYSGPLFLAVVLGLVGGHVLFNASDALFPGVNKAAPSASQRSTRENIMNADDLGDEVESSKDDKAEQDTDKTANCSKMENNNTLPEDSCYSNKTSCGTKTPEVHVPEGITPCCQNTL
jgi:Ctr copper transporter family